MITTRKLSHRFRDEFRKNIFFGENAFGISNRDYVGNGHRRLELLIDPCISELQTSFLENGLTVMAVWRTCHDD